MSAVLGNVEILAILDPGYILAPGSAEALNLLEIAWYTENTTQDGLDFAAEVAFAAAAIANLAIQLKYIDLANDYYDLYDAQRQFYYSNFQNNPNGELGLLNQVFNSPLAGNGQSGTSYNPGYTPQSASVEVFDNTEFGSSQWWSHHTYMYNDTPFTQGFDGYGNVVTNGQPEFLDRRATTTDFDNYLYRYEEHRKDVYDERTWEWQNQSLNFGVKQANVAQSGIATSFSFLDLATTNMADWFATQANGLSRYSGYRSSLASNGAKLASSALQGRNLAMSTQLGVDIGAGSYRADLYNHSNGNSNNSMPSMFMSEEDSMTYESIQR